VLDGFVVVVCVLNDTSIFQVFGALFTKLGVPIPTQISPKVLAVARQLVEGRTADGGVTARELLHGTVVEGRVQKQVCVIYFCFFTILIKLYSSIGTKLLSNSFNRA
jgi:hypothetical protein